MLDQLISRYLQSHKRLVIPQLGAFVVKEPERSVLFSELLKRDDGVLRALIAGEGVGELEAAGEIDRFVFEVRHAVEHGEEYRLEGLGVLRPGDNGTIAFVHQPQPAAGPGPEGEPDGMPGTEEHASSGRLADAARTAFDEPHKPGSTKMGDPALKGLRYGKPHKNTNAYTFVNRAPRRRRIDRFVWIAVAAAIIAVAAIAFGYMRDARERKAEEQSLVGVPAQPQQTEAQQPE